jgi:teichoic acid transport system permease protein
MSSERENGIPACAAVVGYSRRRDDRPSVQPAKTGRSEMKSAKAGPAGQLVEGAATENSSQAVSPESEPAAEDPKQEPTEANQDPMLPDGSLAGLAARYGLTPSAQRAPIGKYLRELANRWSFIMGFATARNIAMYTEAKLGQLWQVLAPLLNAGVYFLIFGVIISGVSRGVTPYLPFLVTGVFVFSFTQRTFISTSKVITDSLPLIRALQFPRAALPLAYVMIELQQMLLSMSVLVVIILLVPGNGLSWSWMLAIPALLLLTIFNAGIGLFAARVGARVNDFAQLLPFLMRTWLYVSGVLYSIQQLVAQHSQNYGWATTLLQLNPAAVYITLVRNSLLTSQRTTAFGYYPYNHAKCALWQGTAKGTIPESAPHYAQYLKFSGYCHPTFISSHLWEIGAGWAVVALLFGFWFFWRKEVFYGRG